MAHRRLTTSFLLLRCYQRLHLRQGSTSLSTRQGAVVRWGIYLHSPPPPNETPSGDNDNGRGRRGRGRGRGRQRGEPSSDAFQPPVQPPVSDDQPSAPDPPGEGGPSKDHMPKSSGKRKAPPAAPFNPKRPFLQSSVSSCAVCETGQIAEGRKLAYYMEVAESMGGTDWFVGEVLRVSKGNWVDVEFADGKLWVSAKPSERGLRWVLFK